MFTCRNGARSGGGKLSAPHMGWHTCPGAGELHGQWKGGRQSFSGGSIIPGQALFPAGSGSDTLKALELNLCQGCARPCAKCLTLVTSSNPYNPFTDDRGPAR